MCMHSIGIFNSSMFYGNFSDTVLLCLSMCLRPYAGTSRGASRSLSELLNLCIRKRRKLQSTEWIFFLRASKDMLLVSFNIFTGLLIDNNVFRIVRRITTVLACQMNFRQFPMDQQTCHFFVGCCKSVELTKRTVQLKFSSGPRVSLILS